MSFDVVEIIQDMDFKNTELQLGLQCAPVIAGIKISNLFTIATNKLKELYPILKKTDLSYHLLYSGSKRAVFLIYKKEKLVHHLKKPEVKRYFMEFGYQNTDLDEILLLFVRRYSSYMRTRKGFPHELGLLLEYPIEDVKGFIENQGKNFLYSGYWKVYGQVEEKISLFRKFEEVQTEIAGYIHSKREISEILSFYERKMDREGGLKNKIVA